MCVNYPSVNWRRQRRSTTRAAVTDQPACLRTQASSLGVVSPAAFLARAPQPPKAQSVMCALHNLLDLQAITPRPQRGYALTPLGQQVDGDCAV